MRVQLSILLLLGVLWLVLPHAASAQAPVTLEPVSQYWAGDAYAVNVLDSYAYVGLGTSLVILSIADPAHPERVGEMPLPRRPYSVLRAGAYVYVADGGAGLRILDISDPAHPIEAGALAIPGEAQGLAIVRRLAYVAAGATGLHIVDISDARHPSELAALRLPDDAWDVAIAGEYAYVAGGSAGLRVIDVSDPAHPREVGQCLTSGPAEGVSIPVDPLGTADHAYVAAWGMRAVDISSPTNPTEVGAANIGTSRLYVAGAHAFVIWRDRLRVVDVSDPTHPAVVGEYTMSDFANDVFVSDSYVYLANPVAGLVTLRFAVATPTPSPTPTSTATLTPTPTSTPSSTPTPMRVWLPAILKGT
jgi:hypothetical protein